MATEKEDGVKSIEIDQIRLLEIDKAVRDWLSNKKPLILNNRKVPVIFGAWERFAQMQGSKDDDKLNTLRDQKGLLKLPLISIKRNGVTPMEDRYLKKDEHGRPYIVFSKKISNAKFQDTRVPFTPKWSDNGAPKTSEPVYDVYKIPYPTFVNISYTVTFWASYVKHANMFHSRIWGDFHPGDINYNGFHFQSFISSSSDESNTEDFSTEERIIRHSFELESQGYFIDHDKVEISRSTSKIVYEETILDDMN